MNEDGNDMIFKSRAEALLHLKDKDYDRFKDFEPQAVWLCSCCKKTEG